MSEVVERVAKAMFPSFWEDGGILPYSENERKRDQGVAMEKARLAIEAMREPTEAMLASAVKEPVHLYAGRANGYVNSMKAATAADRMAARQRWQDLIDAALSNTRESDNG